MGAGRFATGGVGGVLLRAEFAGEVGALWFAARLRKFLGGVIGAARFAAAGGVTGALVTGGVATWGFSTDLPSLLVGVSLTVGGSTFSALAIALTNASVGVVGLSAVGLSAVVAARIGVVGVTLSTYHTSSRKRAWTMCVPAFNPEWFGREKVSVDLPDVIVKKPDLAFTVSASFKER